MMTTNTNTGTQGKSERAVLPVPDATNTVQDGAFVAPRSPLEEWLATLPRRKSVTTAPPADGKEVTP